MKNLGREEPGPPQEFGGGGVVLEEKSARSAAFERGKNLQGRSLVGKKGTDRAPGQLNLEWTELQTYLQTGVTG